MYVCLYVKTYECFFVCVCMYVCRGEQYARRRGLAINWQHEAHPTTGERSSEKVLDPDHRACQERGMRAKIGQVIRGALEGALNQTTANDTGRAGGA